jgi:hypothetical protein
VQSSVAIERTSSSDPEIVQDLNSNQETPNDDEEHVSQDVSSQEYQIEYLEEVTDPEDDQYPARVSSYNMVTVKSYHFMHLSLDLINLS